MSNMLPAPLTSFLGREQETEGLRQFLTRAVRLVTITGPGGVGKTSLALHVAHAVQDNFPDGVFFIPLSAISDPTFIISTIAQALGLFESHNRLLFDSLKDYLGARQALLVLDNFEQIIPAAPLLTELLSACPYLQLLVTSREALRVRGEQEFLLSPLTLPGEPEVERLLQYPGIALFVERAQTTQNEFRLTAEDAAAVAEICSLLDGLPLALELAAARIKLLPPQALLTQLRDSPLKLLTTGARDLPARQRTLRSTVQWSYDLLNDEEQKAFRWFTVFAGGGTLEAALALMKPAASVDLFDSLVNKNLLRSIETNGSVRLVMLQTVREFGWEQLSQAGELDAARLAHAGYFLALTEATESELTGANQKSWLLRLDEERDNLRAALQWAIDHHEEEFVQRLASALQPFWFRRGYWSEGRRWLEAALAISPGTKPDEAVWAKALCAAGTMARFQGDFPRARMLCEQSLNIFRILDDQTGVLKTLVQLCRITRFQGDQEALKTFITEAASLIETLPDSLIKGEAYTDMALSMVDLTKLKFQPEGIRYLAESERIHRGLNNLSGLALASLHRAVRASFEGDFTLAASKYNEAELLAMELGDIRLLSRMSAGLALINLREGDYPAARRRLETSIQQYFSMGDFQLHYNILMLAAVLHKQGQDLWAARVWGLADHIPGDRKLLAALEAYQERFHVGDILAELCSKLGAERFASEFKAGHQLKLEDLRRIPQPDQLAHAAPTSSSSAPLTARELEVLRLLGQELSNPQIAEQLVVSRRTVDAHLRSIYDKLDVKSRDAAIRVASEQGFLNR